MSSPQTVTPETTFNDELPVGTQLMRGQFKIGPYLNHGGFGITYLATDSLDRAVVVKECFPGMMCRRSDLEVVARSPTHVESLSNVVRLFLREARAMSKLDHPNIVHVHQVFEENGTAYMVLDFIEGSDLLDYIEKPDLSLTRSDVKTILEKLLDAISAVHDAGLLHRDIAPDNVILSKGLNPVLIDFGAARDGGTTQSRALSALRIVKEGYSPQEFYLAGSAQSPSSDLYSLAATFYHIITGEMPPDSQQRISAHMDQAPDPYVSLRKKTDLFSDNFCAAIDRAMAVLPKDRLQSAAEWKQVMAPPPPAELATPEPKAVARSRAFSKPRLTSKPKDASKAKPTATPKAASKPKPTATPKTASKPKPAAKPKAAVKPNTFDAAKAALLSKVALAKQALFKPDSKASTPESQDKESRFSRPMILASVAALAVLLLAALLSGPSDDEDTGIQTTDVTQPMPPMPVSPVVTPPATSQPSFLNPTPERAVTAPVQMPQIIEMPEQSVASLLPPVDLQALQTSWADGQITLDWRMDQPFSVSPQGLISNVSDALPVEISTVIDGAELTTFDGVPFSDPATIENRMREIASASDGQKAELNMLVTDPETAQTSQVLILADILYETSLPNGMRTSTRAIDGAWQTTIIEAPTSGQTSVREGDVLVALMSTNQRIDGLTTLAELTADQIQSGADIAAFAIRRGDSLWVGDFMLNGTSVN